VQAFGSDLGLMALALIVKNVPRGLVRPIGFIHDALVAIAPKEKAKEAAKAIKYWMEHIPLEEMFGFKSPIPIIAEAAVGLNLASMIEIKDSWHADEKVQSYYDIQVKEWEADCAKADASGKPRPPRPMRVASKPLVVRRLRTKIRPIPTRVRPRPIKRNPIHANQAARKAAVRH
jgi:hypothetical protein